MQNLMVHEAIIAAAHINKCFKHEIPDVAIILGSGLGKFIDMVTPLESIAYTDIPYFPTNPKGEVLGHKGCLTIARCANGRTVLVMEGRFHLYEGYTPGQVTLPIVVFHELGIKTLIVSNAAGGLNPNFKVGDLMIIDDYINLTGMHPLIGHNDDKLGPRFLDQTNPFDLALREKAQQIAKRLNITPQWGTYLGLTGPTYETKAEIKAFSSLGVDAVGMSTIFEIIVAHYLKIKILAISSITNMASGLNTTPHDHAAIIRASKELSQQFSLWMKTLIEELNDSE